MEDGDGGGGGGSVEAESEAEQEEHEEEAEEEAEGEATSTDEVDSNAGRFVRYQFTPQVGCYINIVHIFPKRTTCLQITRCEWFAGQNLHKYCSSKRKRIFY